jgi:uronate dehydrogenase
MATSPLILVTGSSGRVGRAVVRELSARGKTVRGFDRVPTPGLADSQVGDLSDADAVRRAMAGVHTLIHLAATPDDADFLTELVPNNIVGVYHVLTEAERAGVRRAVLASSSQVVWYQRPVGPWPVRVDDPPTPRHWYAAAKVFLEAAGRAFVEAGRLPSAIAVRLSWCPRTRAQVDEIAASDWAKDGYFSPGDAGRFFACCVDAPDSLKFAVVFGASKPLSGVERVDLEPARRLLGYEPQDVWPQGIEIVTGEG